jgi:hypothetical protein
MRTATAGRGCWVGAAGVVQVEYALEVVWFSIMAINRYNLYELNTEKHTKNKK